MATAKLLKLIKRICLRKQSVNDIETGSWARRSYLGWRGNLHVLDHPVRLSIVPGLYILPWKAD
jgi:hypothetical protein